MKKQIITKTSIAQALSSCKFDPHRPMFKIAVANSDADYCIMRAQEYLEEAKLTRSEGTLKQAVQSIVLAMSFLEKADGTEESPIT